MLWVDFLPILIYLKKKPKKTSYKFIFIYTLFSFLTQVVTIVMSKMGLQNLNVVIFYIVISSIILFYYSFNLVKYNKLLLYAYALFAILVGTLIPRDHFEIIIVALFLSIVVFYLILIINTVKFSLVLDKIDEYFIFSVVIYYLCSIILIITLPYLESKTKFV